MQITSLGNDPSPAVIIVAKLEFQMAEHFSKAAPASSLLDTASRSVDLCRKFVANKSKSKEACFLLPDVPYRSHPRSLRSAWFLFASSLHLFLSFNDGHFQLKLGFQIHTVLCAF